MKYPITYTAKPEPKDIEVLGQGKPTSSAAYSHSQAAVFQRYDDINC